jgi:glutamate transport system substrate-binding protein
MFRTPGRWPRRAAIGLLPLALLVSACSGSGASSSTSTSGSDAGSSGAASAGGVTIDQAAYDAVINAAPVADAATVDALAWAKTIKDRGVLNTGGSDSGPLFSLLDPATGKVTGFDAGLAQMLARYIIGEPKIQLTVTTVDTRETLIQNGTVDTVVATYSITEPRAEKVAFAGPYFTSGAAIMVKKDNTDINSVKDLDGKTVATQAASTGVTALQEHAPGATVSTFDTDAACQAAVTQGRVDAYVIDQSILISDAVVNQEVKVVGEPFTSDPYGIGVTKDDPAVKTFVNDWLQSIYDDGTWAKLWKVTVGTVVAGEAPEPPKIGSVPGT